MVRRCRRMALAPRRTPTADRDRAMLDRPVVRARRAHIRIIWRQAFRFRRMALVPQQVRMVAPDRAISDRSEARVRRLRIPITLRQAPRFRRMASAPRRVRTAVPAIWATDLARSKSSDEPGLVQARPGFSIWSRRPARPYCALSNGGGLIGLVCAVVGT